MRKLTMEFEQEVGGRWICEIREIRGVLAYGGSEYQAARKAISLAFAVLTDIRKDSGIVKRRDKKEHK